MSPRPPFYQKPPLSVGSRRPGGAMGVTNQFQGDIEREQKIRRDAQDAVGIAEIYDLLRARNQPTQLTYNAHYVRLTKQFVPTLIVPRNARRQALIISNFQINPVAPDKGPTQVCWSYDFPVAFDGPVLNPSQIAGNPLEPRTSFIESNGSVSVNDIFVWTNDVNAGFPVIIVAYEGQLSVTGNER